MGQLYNKLRPLKPVEAQYKQASIHLVGSQWKKGQLYNTLRPLNWQRHNTMLPKAVGQASEGSRFWDDAHIKAFSPFQPKTVAIVDRIDAGITPPLFYLKNLLKKKIRRPYYKEQLLLIAEKDIPKYLVVNKNFKIRNDKE